jgi:hypothetical protein
MTIGVLINPTGAGYFDAAPSIGNQHVQVVVDVNSSALPKGTSVELEAYAGPGTGNPPTIPYVQASSATADSLGLGVIVGGETAANATSIAGGAVATVLTEGICQVLCDATTVAGYPLIQSAATSGALKCTSAGAAPTAGRGYGVALQSVTISSGTALVWAYIRAQ